MSKKRDGIEPDIIVSLLKRSSIPTLLVEGSGDKGIYRWLERQLGVGNLDILACGGRSELLKVYERRSEFTGKPVVFLADLDDFLYFGIPLEYKEIIFTTGYSIENDVIHDGTIDYLMDDDERDDFENVLNRMMEIYSRKIRIRTSDRSEELSIHANTIYDFEKSSMKTGGIFDSYMADTEWLEHISSNPRLYIRGKNFISIYTAILSKSSRSSKYSRENIIEMHLKQNGLPEPVIATVYRIRAAFKDMGVTF